MYPPAEKAAYSPANGRKMLGPTMFRDRGEGGAALPLFFKIIKSYYEKSVFSPTMHFESLVSPTTFKVAPRSLMLRPFAWALKMTSTQLVETSVTINNSPSPSYTNPEDHPTTIIDLPGSQPTTVLLRATPTRTSNQLQLLTHLQFMLTL